MKNTNVIFTNNTQNTIDRIVVILNKDNNALLNPAIGIIMIPSNGDVKQWDRLVDNGKYSKIPDNEKITSAVYRTDISGLAPNTKYKMFINSQKEFEIADWNEIYFKNGTIGTIPAGGAWLDFETKDTLKFGCNKFECMFRFTKWMKTPKNISEVFAIPASKYNKNIKISNTTGGAFPINITLKPSDSIVYKDGRFYKRDRTTYEPLSVRANNILTCISYIKNNNTEYNITFYNQEGKELTFTDNFDFIKFNYISTKDKNFVHNGYTYPLTAITLSHGIEPNGHYLPNAFFDIISMGNNTVQISITYHYLYDNNNKPRTIGYQNFFDKIDFAISCGLRVILKFYGWVAQDEPEGQGTWTSQNFVNKMETFEKMFIDKYKNNPSVIGYSVANEPTNAKLSLTDSTILNRYKTFINKMQNYIHQNTNQIIFVELLEGADFTLPNIAFEYHYYTPHLVTHKHVLPDFPNSDYIWRNSIKPISQVYSTTEASIDGYEKVIYKTTPRAKENDYIWSSSGLFKKDENTYPFITSAINLNVGANKIDATLNIKKLRIRFFDKNKNLTRERYFTFSENENLDLYSLQAIKRSNTSTAIEIIDNKYNTEALNKKRNNSVIFANRTDLLNVIQDGNDWVLQLNYNDEQLDCTRIKVGLYSEKELNDTGIHVGVTEVYNSWTNAFAEDEVYYECDALIKPIVKTKYVKNSQNIDVDISSKVKFYTETVMTYIDMAYPAVNSEDFISHIINYKETSKDIPDNIPIYIGEVGTCMASINCKLGDKLKGSKQQGGLTWVNDIIKVIRDKGYAFSWFTYWGAMFGIYESNTTYNEDEFIDNADGTPYYSIAIKQYTSGTSWAEDLYYLLSESNDKYIDNISKIEEYSFEDNEEIKVDDIYLNIIEMIKSAPAGQLLVTDGKGSIKLIGLIND